MNKGDILKRVDLTLLKPEASSKEIIALCEKAAKLKTASVCVPPFFVPLAHKVTQGNMRVCTVIGFPNGYNTLNIKIAEAEEAIKNGADEIDMVINLSLLKDKRYDLLLDEIKSIRNVCRDYILKVIIETCLLTEKEIIDMCKIVFVSGADYIKTSTGFSRAGATVEDIILMRLHCDPSLKIKAAGGIRDYKKAEEMIKNGADRIGTSGFTE